MKCPICIQEVQPLDHQERCGPEFAHSRCIIAFNAGSTVQDAKIQAYIKRLEESGDALYENSDPTRFDSLQAANRKLNAQEAWRKTREAKP